MNTILLTTIGICVLGLIAINLNQAPLVTNQKTMSKENTQGCPNKVTQKDWDDYQEYLRGDGFVRETGFGACVQVVPDGQENSYLMRDVTGSEDRTVYTGRGSSKPQALIID